MTIEEKVSGVWKWGQEKEERKSEGGKWGLGGEWLAHLRLGWWWKS